MSNNPLFGQATNVYNFTGNRATPITLGAYNFMLHENCNRQITDTTTANLLNCPMAAAALAPPREDPFEVTYTFQPEAQSFALRGFQDLPSPCTAANSAQLQQPLQYQIAVKELERQCLEMMLLKEKLLQNPYVLRFTENAAIQTEQAECYCPSDCVSSAANRVSFHEVVTSEETAQTSDIGLPPLDFSQSDSNHSFSGAEEDSVAADANSSQTDSEELIPWTRRMFWRPTRNYQ